MAEAVVQREVQTEVSRSHARALVSSFFVAVAALTMLGLGLRLAGIDREPLWLDEGYTLLFSSMSLPRLIAVGGAHEHPPLYYLLVHTILDVRNSYLVPRVLSACIGTLSIPVVALLGRRTVGTAASLMAAGLVTISPFHLWYSQDGRAYALAGLTVLLSYLFLVRAVQDGERRDWAFYALCTLLALYTEYTTVLVLIPQALLLVRVRRPLILSWAAVALGYLPWAGIVAHDAAGVAADYWIPPPTLGAVIATILEFVGVVTPCLSPPCTGHEVPLISNYDGLLAGAAVLLVAGLLLWAIRRGDLWIILLAGWLLLPFAVIIPLSAERSLYLDRVFLDATFPFYLLVGLAVTAARPGWLRVIGVVALISLLIGNGAASGLVYADHSNPDWKSLGRDLGTAYRPGQAVLFHPGVIETLARYYLPSSWRPSRERALWSQAYLDVPNWQKLYPDIAESNRAERMRVNAILRDRQLAAVSRGMSQVWLVTFNYSGLSDTRSWFLLHGFQPIVSEIYQGDTRLELWSRRAPASLGPVVVPAGFGRGWAAHGNVRLTSGTATENGHATINRPFRVRAGHAYSISVEDRGSPPAWPTISVEVFDRRGHSLGIFPRTKWYDIPVNGVWLDQPFGFVAPPGATRAVLTVGNAWGQISWRNVAVYRSP